MSGRNSSGSGSRGAGVSSGVGSGVGRFRAGSICFDSGLTAALILRLSWGPWAGDSHTVAVPLDVDSFEMFNLFVLAAFAASAAFFSLERV